MFMNEKINSLISKYADLKLTRLDFRISLVKHTVTAAAALVVLCFSVDFSKMRGYWPWIQWVSVLLSICILFGAAFLWLTLKQYSRMDKDVLEQIQHLLEHPEADMQPVLSKYNKGQLLCETICLMAFLLAILLLAGWLWWSTT